MPEGDVLVHAGDLTSSGKLEQLRSAVDWLNEQTKNYEHVICIAGNHDWILEAFYKEGFEKEVREGTFGKVHYLRDSGVTIEGKHFHGSPWTPRFCDWAFNADRGLVIKRWWDMIPMYTNVLITHGPPAGILDWVGKERVGCEELRYATQFSLSRDAHIFGHIHCAPGWEIHEGTTYTNASVLNDQYKIVRAPTVIEI